MKILIADDNFPTRKILGRILEEFGTCDFAENGRIALDAVKMALDERDPYQLICLDIRMPELDGTVSLQLIREAESKAGFPLGSGAKIIMVTGVDDHATIFENFRNNCDGYLLKPVRKDDLVSMLRSQGMI